MNKMNKLKFNDEYINNNITFKITVVINEKVKKLPGVFNR